MSIRGSDTTAAPPLTAMALERINDILDFEVEHILYDRATRNEHYQSLAYFWNLHPAKDRGYGRRFVLLFLAEIMVVGCGCPPYEYVAENGTNLSRLAPPLYTSDRDRWEDLEGDLKKVRALLLRRDATVNFVNASTASGHADNDDQDDERSQSAIFGKHFDSLMRLLQIQKVLAPVRKKLEDSLDAKLSDFTTVVGPRKIKEILEYLESVDDEGVQNAVRSLFREQAAEEAMSARSSNTPAVARRSRKRQDAAAAVSSPSFVDYEELKEKLCSPPFDLCHFQSKLENLIHRMYANVFPDSQSVLMDKCRYTVDPHGSLAEVLNVDRGSRRHFLTGGENSHKKAGRDDVPAAEQRRRRATSQANGDKSSPRRDKRKPNVQIVDDMEFNESDEEGVLEQARRHTRSQLQDNPRKRMRGIAATKGELEGVPPADPGIFDEEGRVLRRIRWSEEEKQCIINGVKKFGVGQWALIKKEYGQELRNRTSVQIKDKWRTMTKAGEVEPPDSPGLIQQQEAPGNAKENDKVMEDDENAPQKEGGGDNYVEESENADPLESQTPPHKERGGEEEKDSDDEGNDHQQLSTQVLPTNNVSPSALDV